MPDDKLDLVLAEIAALRRDMTETRKEHHDAAIKQAADGRDLVALTAAVDRLSETDAKLAETCAKLAERLGVLERAHHEKIGASAAFSIVAAALTSVPAYILIAMSWFAGKPIPPELIEAVSQPAIHGQP